MTILDPEYKARAWQWIGGLFEQVTSADAAYAVLRETPYYAPRRVVREAWREYKEVSGFEDIIGTLPGESFISRDKMADLEWEGMRSPYIFRFEYKGYDEETGTWGWKQAAFNADYNENLDTLQDMANEALMGYDPNTIDWIVPVVFHYPIHKAGAAW